MFHRLTIYLICFFMTGMNVFPNPVYAAQNFFSSSFNETEMLEKYPGAEVIRVTPEEYKILEEKLRQRGYRRSEVVPLQLAKNNYLNDAEISESRQQDIILVDDCAGNGDDSAGEESFRIMVDFTEDMMNTGNSSSSEDAAVLFVIVGTVVVVVWALYVFKYLYDVSLGNTLCGRWDELMVVKSVASTGEAQHARFDGLRYSTGFREGSLDVGIGFELGQADILLSEVGVLELTGHYWLLGPILRWRLTQGINASYFQMNFSAGSTENDEVGLLAKASMGLLFGLGDSMQLGLNWGTLNIHLDDNQGIISDRSQYHYIYGINVGFRF